MIFGRGGKNITHKGEAATTDIIAKK